MFTFVLHDVMDDLSHGVVLAVIQVWNVSRGETVNKLMLTLKHFARQLVYKSLSGNAAG